MVVKVLRGKVTEGNVCLKSCVPQSVLCRQASVEQACRDGENIPIRKVEDIPAKLESGIASGKNMDFRIGMPVKVLGGGAGVAETLL